VGISNPLAGGESARGSGDMPFMRPRFRKKHEQQQPKNPKENASAASSVLPPFAFTSDPKTLKKQKRMSKSTRTRGLGYRSTSQPG
jgi:hypothetical protein